MHSADLRSQGGPRGNGGRLFFPSENIGFIVHKRHRAERPNGVRPYGRLQHRRPCQSGLELLGLRHLLRGDFDFEGGSSGFNPALLWLSGFGDGKLSVIGKWLFDSHHEKRMKGNYGQLVIAKKF